MINYTQEEKLNTTIVEEGFIFPLQKSDNNSLDIKTYGGVFDKKLNFTETSLQPRFDNYTNACIEWNNSNPPPHIQNKSI